MRAYTITRRCNFHEFSNADVRMLTIKSPFFVYHCRNPCRPEAILTHSTKLLTIPLALSICFDPATISQLRGLILNSTWIVSATTPFSDNEFIRIASAGGDVPGTPHARAFRARSVRQNQKVVPSGSNPPCKSKLKRRNVPRVD
jgi:hypothetical protein